MIMKIETEFELLSINDCNILKYAKHYFATILHQCSNNGKLILSKSVFLLDPICLTFISNIDKQYLYLSPFFICHWNSELLLTLNNLHPLA